MTVASSRRRSVSPAVAPIRARNGIRPENISRGCIGSTASVSPRRMTTSSPCSVGTARVNQKPESARVNGSATAITARAYRSPSPPNDHSAKSAAARPKNLSRKPADGRTAHLLRPRQREDGQQRDEQPLEEIFVEVAEPVRILAGDQRQHDQPRDV